MKKSSLIALVAAMPLAATELPPTVPVGPVQYEAISYQPSASPQDPYASASSSAPQASAGYAPATYNASVPYSMAPASTSQERGYLNLNAYTTNYQVRGMGVTNGLSKHGYSSLSGSYILPNRNLFGMGIQQRISGEAGVIWDASCPLGDTPVFQFNYAWGKEIFPNLTAEVGYSLHRGGLEGLMVRVHKHGAHRIAQELNLALRFNDHQKGFFGHAVWGIGFQGLTGSYFDVEAGYRFTDVLMTGNIGLDVEASVGVAPSLGYWGGGVEGIDAWRARLSLLPYAQTGTFGRDSRWYIRPWMQYALSGSNARKLDRYVGAGPIDHSQLTIGIDLGMSF